MSTKSNVKAAAAPHRGPKCKYCEKPIVWARDGRTAAWLPLTPSGSDHREYCEAPRMEASRRKIRARNHEQRVTEFLTAKKRAVATTPNRRPGENTFVGTSPRGTGYPVP